MWWSKFNVAMVMVSGIFCLAAAAGQPDRERAAPRPTKAVPRPSWREVSAAEQSAWIDENLPILLAAMAASPEVRDKIAGSLSTERVPPPFPLRPQAGGLASVDLDRSSHLVRAAVAGSSRYGGGAMTRPRPTVAVMSHTGIVRVEMTYPAPPASKSLEPGPLTLDLWFCPDRETALALYWLRRWGVEFFVPAPPGELAKSIAAAPDFGKVEAAEKGLGESSYVLGPRLQSALPMTKADAPIPADRVSYLRGNVVVEASTVEFVWDEQQKIWLALFLNQCRPDVVAIVRAIDAELIRLSGRGDPVSK